MNGQPQLREGAEHPLAQFAAQLGGLDFMPAGQHRTVYGGRDEVADLEVLCAGDDLKNFRTAHIDLADHHVVGIGMRDDRKNFADDNIFNFTALDGVAFHLRAGHRHRLGEFSRSDMLGNGGVISQPSH